MTAIKQAKLIVFSVLLLSSKVAIAQLFADNWLFNPLTKPTIFNFRKGTIPKIFSYDTSYNTFLQGVTSATSYSDKYGNLQFSFNGPGLVKDKNFKAMPSADYRIGGKTIKNNIILDNYLNQGFQSTVAIPYPNRDSLYILFHVDEDPLINTNKYKFYYSIINMNKRGGLGDVDSSNMNNLLLSGQDVANKLAVISHCNKKDVWIIGHLVNSTKYFSLLVTSNGVINSPNYFDGEFIPSVIDTRSFIDYSIGGAIKISPKGDKLAATFTYHNFVELQDFNTSTGIGSNIKKITMPFGPPTIDPFVLTCYLCNGPRGLEFSPTGKKLYLSYNYDTAYATLSHAYLFQYNLNLPTIAQISNSAVLLDSFTKRHAGAIQLANNGKMYFNSGNAISQINQPDSLGLACQLDKYYIPRNSTGEGYNYFTVALPIYNQTYFRHSIAPTTTCNNTTVSFKIKNTEDISNIEWNFGDPASGLANTANIFSPTHTFSAAGVYNIKVAIQHNDGCATDTLLQVVYAGTLKAQLGNDTSICKGDSLVLKINIPNALVEWSNGIVADKLVVKKSGSYWAKVYLGECISFDTINVTVVNLPVFSLGKDSIICSNTQLLLKSDSSFTNAQYIWNTNATSPQILTSVAGTYWLKITNQQGCVFKDTINISFKTLPNFTLGADTSICTKDSLLLTANVVGASNYTWNTGAATQSIYVQQAGNFWCAVTKDGCIYTDSINILLKPLPIAQLGVDTTLCAGVTKTLQSPNVGATYTWQDGSSNPIYTVNKAGLYHILVTKNNCIAKDSIQISYIDKPQFTLGNSRFICPTENIILNPTIQPSWQLQWQNNSTAKTYTVTQPGLYYLDATNICGTIRQQVQITEGLCKVYIPSAFSPNNDGKNDVFKIAGTSLISNFHLQIFNRFGQQVFETTDKFKGWNGQFNNQPAESATYIYVLQYKDNRTGEQKLHKGSILLLK